MAKSNSATSAGTLQYTFPTIQADGQASRAYLHIGHHRMVGRLQTLKTPFAVLVDKPTSETSSVEDKEWQLHTIIRKKLVFDVRPEPVFPDEPS